jgi:hypothetical protein
MHDFVFGCFFSGWCQGYALIGGVGAMLLMDGVRAMPLWMMLILVLLEWKRRT